MDDLAYATTSQKHRQDIKDTTETKNHTVKFECEMMWFPCKFTATADDTLLYDTNIQCEMMWLSCKFTATIAPMEIPSNDVILL